MRQGLYYCRFSDSVVILDSISDRYRLLKGESADRFNRAVEGTASVSDQDWLAKNKIEFSNCSQPAAIVAPVASALGQVSRRNTPLVTIQAAWHQLRYQRSLRLHPLHQLIDTLMERRPRYPIADDQRSREIAAGFARAKRFISAHDQCLPRALAMTHMLFRAGIRAQLVFGVTMPFAAHCWVQQDEIVLSDPLDRVLPFRPIMVLG